MMKRIHILLPLCLALVAALASCIREELQPGPPLSVKIGIEDKNYVNIDEVAQLTGGLVSRLDENLPFRSYIQKLYYSLYSIDSAKVVLTRHLHEVQGDAKEATAYLPEDLGFGEYVLVVWGNIDSEDGIQRNGAAYDLHTGHVAGYDVYMTCDTLLYDDTHYDYTVMLERVKGQLLIEAKKLPANIRRSRKAVSRVHGGVDYRFRYEGGEGEYLVTDYYDLEESNGSTTRFSSFFMRQEASSVAVVNGITLTNGQTRNNYRVELAGEGAATTLAGMAILDQEQRLDTYTHLTHAVARCHSDELFKYVLNDQAVGAFSGRILVKEGAEKTEAYQSNRNLCATREARMYSKPQLEIYADDVKCSHGMSTGQLDEEALFYMRSRGIALEEARTLLSVAFTADVIEHVRVEALKERLHRLVEKRFRGELAKCAGCGICR